MLNAYEGKAMMQLLSTNDAVDASNNKMVCFSRIFLQTHATNETVSVKE